jgi:hypothetical protein
MVFNINLSQIFQEIYILTKTIGFEATYVELLPPIEREIYINMYYDELEQEKNNSKESASNITPHDLVHKN